MMTTHPKLQELQTLIGQLQEAAEQMQTPSDPAAAAYSLNTEHLQPTINAAASVATEIDTVLADLSQSEERFRLLVNAVADYAIFMLDPSGLILSWNRGAQHIKGYAAEEIIGQHFARFYLPGEVAAGKPMTILAVAAQWGHYAEEGWRLRKDGSRFWASVVITALYNKEGVLQGFGKVTRDLTERKVAEEALRQSEERFRLLIEGVRDYAIFMLDPQGIVTSWNLGAQLIKGYLSHEVVGRHFSIFYPPEEIAAGKPINELILAQSIGHYEEEGWRLRKDGSRFWASVVITPIYDATGVLRGYSKVTRDLSERKRSDEERFELQRRELELALERGKRQQMEHAIQERDAFLIAAAHELKTPLTTLLGSAEHQLRRLTRTPDMPAAEQQRAARIVHQALRLRRLVSGLVEVTRLAQSELKLDTTMLNIVELVQRVVNEIQPTLNHHTLETELPAEALMFLGDRERLELVVYQLIQNAIKYSPNGGCIRVAITVQATVVELTVSDEGLGIMPNDLPRIFDRFYRGQHEGHSITGMGIGLYLAHEVISLHGGSITVRSTVDAGTQFIVSLPYVPAVRTETLSEAVPEALPQTQHHY